MPHPLPVPDFGEPENFGGVPVQIRLGGEQAGRVTVARQRRVLDHGPDGGVGQAHAAVQKVVFQLGENTVALGVAVEVLEVRQFLVGHVLQRVGIAVLAEPFPNGGLPRMPEGRVTDIVGQAGRLDDGPEMVLVDALGQIFFNQVINCHRKAASHAGHLDTVGQTAVHMVVYGERVHLGLAAQPAESRRKNDAVKIPMKVRTVGVTVCGVTIAGSRKKSFPVQHQNTTRSFL